MKFCSTNNFKSYNNLQGIDQKECKLKILRIFLPVLFYEEVSQEKEIQ